MSAPTTFGMILTAQGITMLAAYAASGTPLNLAFMAVGDAGSLTAEGYVPTGNETALVHETARVGLDGVQPEAGTPYFDIQGTIPAVTGGFYVREVGIYTAGGILFAIGNYPPFFKPAPSSGFAADLTIKAIVEVSNQATIQLVIDASQVFATHAWVQQNEKYILVNSATTTAPPIAPAVGDHYLVAPGGVGAWLGQSGKVAIWLGVTDGWLFFTPSPLAIIAAVDTGVRYERTLTGYRTLMATADEALAGADANHPITPATLKTTLNGAASAALLFYGMMG